MRLSIIQSDGSSREMKFKVGPIYIGRQQGCQIFLPDRGVSRQHAVIYTDDRGNWLIEDLDSANKTYLNGGAVHKSRIKNDDSIRIGNFSIRIEVDEEEEYTPESSIRMDETIMGAKYEEVHAEIRQECLNAAPFKMPSKRANDFSKAASEICMAPSIKELYKSLQGILLGQFAALDVWVGLRREPQGAMEMQGGKKITSESVNLTALVGKQNLAEAIDNSKYMLIPQLPMEMTSEGIRSAIIAPVLRGGKCYGILYAENSTKHEHYTPADLDYLILVSILAAAVLENL